MVKTNQMHVGWSRARFTINLDRLIGLSESSLLGWVLEVYLIVIIKGRSPMEVSSDQTVDRIKI
jgi:hypothetical protein